MNWTKREFDESCRASDLISKVSAARRVDREIAQNQPTASESDLISKRGGSEITQNQPTTSESDSISKGVGTEIVRNQARAIESDLIRKAIRSAK